MALNYLLEVYWNLTIGRGQYFLPYDNHFKRLGVVPNMIQQTKFPFLG